jgi:hypothetical protein
MPFRRASRFGELCTQWRAESLPVVHGAFIRYDQPCAARSLPSNRRACELVALSCVGRIGSDRFFRIVHNPRVFPILYVLVPELDAKPATTD